MLKKALAIILTTLICFSTFVPPTFASDLPSSWAAKEVADAIQIGIVPYTLQSNYQDDITREEFARFAVCFLAKQYGYTENQIYSQFYEDFFTYYTNQMGDSFSKADFIDSSNGIQYSWSYILNESMKVFNDYPNRSDGNANINTAYLLGIVKGIGGEAFNPSGKISRQEAATMLSRTYSVIASNYNLDDELITYKDSSTISNWAQNGVAFTYEFSILIGDENNNFNPQEHLTREQSILAFLRLYNNTPDSCAQGVIHSLKSTEEIIVSLTSSLVYGEMPYRYDGNICTVVYITYGGYLGDYPQNVLHLIYPTGTIRTVSIPDAPLDNFLPNEAGTQLTCSSKIGIETIDYCIDLQTGQLVSPTLPYQN